MRTETLRNFLAAREVKTKGMVFALAAIVLLSNSALAAESDSDQAAELAKKLNNPISSLISVPLQSNWDYGFGDGSGEKYTLNIQPVIPVSIGKDWNLIVRTILPVIDQTHIYGPRSGNQSGLGNTTQSFFFSPKAPGPGGIIWGVGPVGYYPTNTDNLIAPDKWGVGPTFVALVQPGAWTIGMLANQIWSVGGDNNEQDINSTFMQPFVSYTTKTHTTFTLNTESTYDWENNQWTVPLNLTLSQIFKLGKLPVQATIGARYYAESPNGGPDWGLRAVFTFLFPTGKHETPAPGVKTSAK